SQGLRDTPRDRGDERAMPRKPSPPRLWFRPDTATWVIKDGSKRISTGCGAADAEAAERALAEYLISKYEAPRGGRASEITIGDVLAVYLAEKLDTTKRTKDMEQAIARVNEFFGTMPVSDIKGRTCREFATHRNTPAGARRDLET